VREYLVSTVNSEVGSFVNPYVDEWISISIPQEG
jgi:hypothetical protein